jgi:hypothetical protein
VVLWRGAGEAWVNVCFAVLSFEQFLRLTGIPLEHQPLRWAVAALVISLIAMLFRRMRPPLLHLWVEPLRAAVYGLAFMAVAIGWAYAYTNGRVDAMAMQSFAVILAITGLTTIGQGFDRRMRILAYAGVALVEAGYMLQLLVWKQGQPQFFVLPAGIYLLAVAYFEWRRGEQPHIKGLVETAGLAILLVTSLVQAIGFMDDGIDRYVYATLMIPECLILIALGAIFRWKRTFFAGSVALVLDVLVLLADPVRATNTWYLIGIVGLVMLTIVVFLEQRRQALPIWFNQWRERLEAWD